MTAESTANQEDITVPGIELTQLRKHQVFNVLLTDVFTPLLALTAIASASTGSVTAFLQLMTLAALETLVMLLSYTLLIGRFDPRVSNGISIIMYAVFSAYWFWGLRANGSLYILLTGYTGIVLWRFHAAASTDLLNDLIRSGFLIDSVAVFLMSLYYYVWAVPVGGVIPTDVKPLFEFLLFVGVLFRIYWLWRGERLVFQTRAAPAWLVWVLLSIALLAIISIHRWVLTFVGMAGSAAMSVLTPILAHLPFPSIHLHGYRPKLPDLVPPFFQTQQKHTHYLITPVLHWLYILLTAFLVFLFLFFLLRRRKLAETTQPASDDVAKPEIIRRSLTDMGRNQFLQTNNPIRLQVQDWLRIQLRRGRAVSESLSFRSMAVRSQEHSPDLESLVEAYERERYGWGGSEADREIDSDE